MPTSPVLNLPESNLSAVWDVVKARLTADQVLKDAGVHVEVAEDLDSLRSPSEFGAFAVIQVYGDLGRWEWFHEQQQSGALLLAFSCWLPSVDPRDHFNLQQALAVALTPDDGLEFQRSLTGAGAETGLIAWPRPLQREGASQGRPPRDRDARLVGLAAIQVRTPVLDV